MAEPIENEKLETIKLKFIELKMEIQKGIDSADKGDLFEIDEVFDPFLIEANPWSA